ncbi:hypothetical protein [Qaidamihabitans albus]|uniref:hypothetical protein n=1 Tax=Qaidamihabitans albus TaxID=2795733 RepID=UPI0018F20D2E|nr:hypothetical protein [Qaidamihabitans albus]
MAHEESFQVDDRLTVREDDLAYLVVLDNDEDDWLVRFEKAPDFAAREWAEHMVVTYNERLRSEDDEYVRLTARPPSFGPGPG